MLRSAASDAFEAGTHDLIEADADSCLNAEPEAVCRSPPAVKSLLGAGGNPLAQLLYLVSREKLIPGLLLGRDDCTTLRLTHNGAVDKDWTWQLANGGQCHHFRLHESTVSALTRTFHSKSSIPVRSS